MAQERLAGQVAFVTGGGRGIGRVIVDHLVRQGAAVAVFGRNEDTLRETARAIELSGGRAIAVSGDVTNKDDVQAAVQRVEHELGPITLLVNNAGLGGAGGPIWQTDPDEWWQVMEVNLKGPFLCTHAILGGMVERRCGRIVNVGSYQGILPNPMATSYATSKAALLRLTDSVAEGAKEFGVSVFAISPGFVWTDMTRDLERTMKELAPDEELIDEAWVFPAEDAAGLCVRLASGEADKLTGRFIHVKDDLDQMIATAEKIVSDDRYVLRLTADLEIQGQAAAKT